MIANINSKETTNALWEQERAAERMLELTLIEAVTALLCWCERAQDHPNYAASVSRKPTIAATIRSATCFALRRRAELMTHRSSAARMKEEVKRLKSMVAFLKNKLWSTSGKPPSESVQNPPTLLN